MSENLSIPDRAARVMQKKARVDELVTALKDKGVKEAAHWGILANTAVSPAVNGLGDSWELLDRLETVASAVLERTRKRSKTT